MSSNFSMMIIAGISINSSLKRTLVVLRLVVSGLLIPHLNLAYGYITYIEPRVPLQGNEAQPGTPWPLPQKWTQSPNVLYVHPKSFVIDSEIKGCDVIDQAIPRSKAIMFPKALNSIQPANDLVLDTVLVNIQDMSCQYPQYGDDESYEIAINQISGSFVKSKTIWGAIRGLETLTQLVYVDHKTRFYTINETYIKDWPSYAYRGILLDTGRHYVPLKTILSNLDAMAYNKMNVFHWHIVDDQSFPLESKRFPNLTRLGAYSPNHVYSQSMVKKVVEYARLRGIRVLPEIDSPGHTKSFGRAFPDLITPCYGEGPDKPFTPNYTWYSESEILNPTLDATYEFMMDLFREVKGLFPDKYVHLGMDEVRYGCWQSNPQLQEFMEKHGMNYTHQLEQYYVERTIYNLKRIKYKYMIWQDPIDNGVQAAADTIVQVWKDDNDTSWQDYTSMVAQQGYKVVLSSCWYLNYITYPKPGNDWELFYRCDPRNFSGTEGEKELIIGGEACMWGEYVDATNLMPRLWPRACAVAERLWTDPQELNEGDARFRLDQQRCRMVERGIPASPILNGFCGSDDWNLRNGSLIDESENELERRRKLIDNYRLTPDLVSACQGDIDIFCKDKSGSHIVHCLIDHIHPAPASSVIADTCRQQLYILLKQIRVAEDWRADPLLQETCQVGANTLCGHLPPGEGKVLSCLMSSLDSVHMGDDCRRYLLHHEYFISRDFELDLPLYKACHKEVVTHCPGSVNTHFQQVNGGQLIMSCLYRRAYHSNQKVALSSTCLNEVRRVMRQRAAGIDLLPDVEEPCMGDLARYCSHDTESLVQKGFEMECLQSKLDILSKECREAVSTFTEDEAGFVELNHPLYTYCHSILKEVCNEDEWDADNGELMECLIEHKNTLKVQNHPNCKVAIEHFQLLSLKDYRFSFKFKKECKEDVVQHCRDKSLPDVVACLSTLVFNDTVSGTRIERVSQRCKDQLRDELAKRSENILLDPELHKACKTDMKKFCSSIAYGEGKVLECLKSNMYYLSKSCHKLIFKRERIEMMDNSVDYALMTTCRQSIEKFCDTSKTDQVLFCLRDNLDEIVEPFCRKVVLRRLGHQSHDYRLNPRLKLACKNDANKFCAVFPTVHQEGELDGQVITCLKKHYINGKLSKGCRTEMVSFIRVIARNPELDLHLMKSCKEDLETKCDGVEDVQECLKDNFRNGELKINACRKEVALLVEEEKRDIRSDPVLYRTCLVDIDKFCQHLPTGRGAQLDCLLTALNAELKISNACAQMLRQRVQMYRFANQIYADNFVDVVRVLSESPSRNYFFFVILSFIFILFLVGLLSGRVSKRPYTKKE